MLRVSVEGEQRDQNSGKVKRTRILAALMQEMCGTAARKLELFEKLKAARMLEFEDSWDIKKTEETLRARAAEEKKPE